MFQWGEYTLPLGWSYEARGQKPEVQTSHFLKVFQWFSILASFILESPGTIKTDLSQYSQLIKKQN